MKPRIFALLAAACLLCSGCHRQNAASPAPVTASPAPARTLLVVPFDGTGAQAFLLLHFSSDGDVAVRAYPRETVFPESGEETTLYTQFASGGAVGFSAVTAAFSAAGVPIDRVFSVGVSDADRGLYPLLAALSNNLLFTAPPPLVYTASDASAGSPVALSSSALRRLLALPATDYPALADYAAFRGQTAGAVIHNLAEAFADDPSALFSALVSAGRSTFVPADETTFSALFSPAPRVRFCPVAGRFEMAATTRFYPETSHPNP